MPIMRKMNLINMHFWTYLEMRAKLQLLSLHSRRLFIKLQYVYKIINNINYPKQLTGYLMKRSQ